MAQSSVEWLINEIDMQFPHIDIKWKEQMISQAKAMHKEEIETAYQSERYPCSDYDAQEYYNQTFGE